MTIPNTVIAIGTEAFARNLLSSITLSENLQYIGDAAFSFNNIAVVTLPSSLQVRLTDWVCSVLPRGAINNRHFARTLWLHYSSRADTDARLEWSE